MASTIITSKVKWWFHRYFREGAPGECWYPRDRPGLSYNEKGYAQCTVKENGIISHYRLSRLSWMIANSKIELDSKIDVCHTCDNPPCLNPDHLFTGNNMVDRDEKNRQAKGETQGSAKLTQELVNQLRLEWRTGRYPSYRAAGIAYNVSKETARNAINRITYKD